MIKTHSYPNPWDLRYFQEVASTENLSRAAERLGVSQSTLSLSLKRLEEAVRTQLFSRRNRGLVLTQAGYRVLAECNRLLTDWDAVIAEVQKSETEIKGRFRLGCHSAVGIYTLDPFLRMISKDHPDIEFQFVHGLSRVVCERVIAGELEFGIVVNPIRHGDLVIKRLGTDEVCFWKAQISVDDVLLYNPLLIQSQSLLKRLKKKAFRRTTTSESLELLTVLARSGAGVAILPTRVVRALSPSLKKLADYPYYTDEIAFIYRADIGKSAAVRTIIEKLGHISI